MTAEAPFGGIFLDMGFQPVKPVAKLFNELLMIKPLVDDDMLHGQSQGHIGTRPNSEPDIGPSGHRNRSGVDHNQFGPPPQSSMDDSGLRRSRHIRLGSPKDDAFRIKIVGAEFISNRIAEGRAIGHDIGMDARVSAQMGVRGRPKPFGDLGRLDADMLLSGAAGNVDGLRAVFFLDILEPAGDGIECLVPGDPLPLFFAPLSGPFQWILQAIGVVHHIRNGRSLDTDRRTIQAAGRFFPAGFRIIPRLHLPESGRGRFR